MTTVKLPEVHTTQKMPPCPAIRRARLYQPNPVAVLAVPVPLNHVAEYCVSRNSQTPAAAMAVVQALTQRKNRSSGPLGDAKQSGLDELGEIKGLLCTRRATVYCRYARVVKGRRASC